MKKHEKKKIEFVFSPRRDLLVHNKNRLKTVNACNGELPCNSEAVNSIFGATEGKKRGGREWKGKERKANGNLSVLDY